jgi:pimeloyl-ACP methyl ester carboxylesterase
MRLTLRLAGATVAALLLAVGGSASAAVDWGACRDGFGAECARVTVPLDRSGALAGTIALRVARMPGPERSSTLLYLSGGPGSSGVDELESVLWTVSNLTTHFRVVTFDQRGTGRSGLLRCPEIEHDLRLRSTAAGEACASRLGAGRTHYTTADSVADLEAVRQALGVERLTLFGISYGTEVALAYARAHPGHVERLALDSVVDPDDADPFGLAGFRAMGPTLAALCPAHCRGVSADPAADIARLTARLRATRLSGRVFDARGVGRTRRLTSVVLADLLYDADYLPPLRAGVPAAVRAALGGDAAPLLRLARVGDALSELSAPSVFSGARYATTCEETPLPWDATTVLTDRWAEAARRAAALGEAAFRPFDFPTAAADEIELCLRWPGVPSSAAPAAAYPAIPTLMLQGAEDLRTPPEVSTTIAAQIPGARRLTVRGVGHSVVSGDPTGCAAGLLVRFLEGALPPAETCRSVPTGVPAVKTPPPRLADVTPLPLLATARRPPTQVRRTAAAVGLTLDDVRFALSPAFLHRAGGGLRGGTYRDTGRGLVLARYEAVGGVRLSGRWHGRQLRLRIGGPAAAHGRLVITPAGRFRGVLAGHRITGRLAHRPPRPISRGGVARTAVSSLGVARAAISPLGVARARIARTP